MPEKELLNNEIMDKMRGMSQREINYIKNRYAILRTKDFEGYLKNTENTNITAFCKKMQYVDLNTIQEYKNNIYQDQELYITLNGLIKFIKSNNGEYPNLESKDETEQKIALKLKELISCGKLGIEFEELEKLLNLQWCNMHDIVAKVSFSGFKQSDIKRVILETMEFLKNKGRRPFKNSSDDNEKDLATEYEKICTSFLKESDIAILNKVLNSKQNLRKSIQEYAKNKKEGR